jgi:excisionase family DNA binding protein
VCVPSDARLLTVRQTAAYLSCTIWAVRNLAWSHEVPHIKLGHRLLFDRQDLDKFIESRKAA